MKNKFLNRVFTFVLCLALVITALPATVQAEETATFNEAVETVSDNDAEEVETVSGNEAEEYNIWELDWKNASDDEIQTYIDNTDIETVGRWYVSLPEDEQEAILLRDTILNKETSAVEYEVTEITEGEEAEATLEETGTTFTGTYVEWAVNEYQKNAGNVKATIYFANKSGYYNYQIIKGDKSVTYRLTVSGIDTTKDITKKQTVTLACTRKSGSAISGVNFWSNGGNYNVNNNGYETKTLVLKLNETDGTSYTQLNNRWGFTKPAGYTATMKLVDKTSGKAGTSYLYSSWHKDTKVAFTKETNVDAAVNIDLVSHTNLCNNSTVGYTSGSSVNAGKAMTYQVTLTPSAYTVNYNGNGETGGSTASQICTYDVSYLRPANGFSKTHTVTYNGNGGIANEASKSVNYTFAGWSTNQYATSGEAVGNPFVNQATSGIVNMYATWGAVPTVILPNATRTGYQFQGWATSATGAAAYSTANPYPVTANTTLYASWKPNTYTVKYITGEGTAVEDTTATYDTQFMLPSTSRVGYEFKGWTGATLNKASAGSYAKNLTDTNGDTVTLTAEWEAATGVPYKVIHKGNTEIDKEYKITLLEETFYGTAGDTVPVASKTFDYYQACDTPIQTVTIAADGSTVVTFYYDAEEKNTVDVKVKHYIRKTVGGEYELFLEELKINQELGSILVPELNQDAIDAVNAIENHSCIKPEQKTITVQEGSVVEYYYDIEKTAENVVINHYIRKSVGGEYELYKTETKQSVKIGNAFTPELNQKAIDEVNSVTYCACVEPKLKTITVEDGSVVDYYYDIKKVKTDVVINHYIKKALDGDYELYKAETKKAVEIGSVITPELNQKAIDEVNAVKGCKCVIPSTKTITVKDGSEVNYYYDIEKDEVSELIEKIVAGDPVNIENNDIDYNVVKDADGTFIIKSINTTTEKLVIPDVFQVGDNIYKVSKISDKAFVNNTTLKEVVVSGNIHTIGTSAFEGCKNLKKVTLKSGIAKINAKAFKNCTSLTSIKIPATVQSIGNNAFEGCTKLKTVTLNNGLLTIGNNVFLKCKALTKITIPASVIKIGAYAFKDCAKLKTVSYKSGSQLLSMGTGTFQNCKALTKITLPNKLGSVPQKAFYNCTKLKTVTIGSNVTSIGSSAFTGTAITKITIPAKVQTISKQAFYKCKSLKTVTIKSKVLTSVGSKAFKNCHKSISFKLPKAKVESYKKLIKGKV